MGSLNLLVLSLLVASSAALPRSKGQLLNQGFRAQSGGGVQNPNFGQANFGFQNQQNLQYPGSFRQVNPSPNKASATFQVNPQTLEVLGQIPDVPQDLRNQQLANPSQNQQAGFQQAGFQQAGFQQPAFQQPGVQQPGFQQPGVQQPFNNPGGNFPSQNLQAAFQQPPAAPTNRPARPGIPGAVAPQQSGISGIPVRQAATTGIISPSVTQEIVQRLIGNPPGGALLVGTNPPLFPLEQRLISNYTKLRPVVSDTFRCDKASVPNYVGYGYYGDVDNECQIFHVCLPWKQLYPKSFDQEVTYQFSFICPNQTVFSQDTMTCSWKSEAVPCEVSPQLYWLNNNFFRKVPDEGGFGTRYAEVNEPVNGPIVTDYDYFNPVDGSTF